MRTLLLLVIFCSSFSLEARADYFKWEILFAEKGFGTEFETIPMTAEGKVEFTDKKIECRMESFWTRMEADLLLEGKTLVCVNRDKENSVSVVCRDNNLNRKYNLLKELVGENLTETNKINKLLYQYDIAINFSTSTHPTITVADW